MSAGVRPRVVRVLLQMRPRRKRVSVVVALVWRQRVRCLRVRLKRQNLVLLIIIAILFDIKNIPARGEGRLVCKCRRLGCNQQDTDFLEWGACRASAWASALCFAGWNWTASVNYLVYIHRCFRCCQNYFHCCPSHFHCCHCQNYFHCWPNHFHCCRCQNCFRCCHYYCQSCFRCQNYFHWVCCYCCLQIQNYYLGPCCHFQRLEIQSRFLAAISKELQH